MLSSLSFTLSSSTFSLPSIDDIVSCVSFVVSLDNLCCSIEHCGMDIVFIYGIQFVVCYSLNKQSHLDLKMSFQSRFVVVEIQFHLKKKHVLPH